MPKSYLLNSNPATADGQLVNDQKAVVGRSDQINEITHHLPSPIHQPIGNRLATAILQIQVVVSFQCSILPKISSLASHQQQAFENWSRQQWMAAFTSGGGWASERKTAQSIGGGENGWMKNGWPRRRLIFGWSIDEMYGGDWGKVVDSPINHGQLIL